MRRVRHTVPAGLFVGLVALLTLGACSGDDDGGKPNVSVPVPFDGELTVPDDWRGIWEMTFDRLDETSGQMHTQTVWYDTLCTGDTLSVTFGPLMGACDGYVKGDSLVFAAQESWDEGPCTVTLVLDLHARRQGDTVSGAGEWRIETSGTCGSASSIVGRDLIELVGVRTAVAAGDCP